MATGHQHVERRLAVRAAAATAIAVALTVMATSGVAPDDAGTDPPAQLSFITR